MRTKKIAIVHNSKRKYCSYESHHYNLFFKIFGITVMTFIESGVSQDEVIENTKRKIFGKLELVTILEINNIDNEESK